jgi:hypothetical protein
MEGLWDTHGGSGCRHRANTEHNNRISGGGGVGGDCRRRSGHQSRDKHWRDGEASIGVGDGTRATNQNLQLRNP